MASDHGNGYQVEAAGGGGSGVVWPDLDQRLQDVSRLGEQGGQDPRQHPTADPRQGGTGGAGHLWMGQTGQDQGGDDGCVCGVYGVCMVCV